MTLRQLARAHAKGKLDMEEYRSARSELIEGILEGEIEVPENNYPAPVKPRSHDDTFEEVTERKLHKQNQDTTIPPDEEPSLPDEFPEIFNLSRTEPEKKSAWPLVTGVSGLILIAILVYVLLPASTPEQEDSVSTPPVISSADTGTTDTASLANTAEARSLIRAFLKERIWTEESIRDFLSAWQALPDEQRAGIQDSVELGRLGNAIYKQFLAEQALSGLDDSGRAMEKQKLLVNFADQIGINDPRISMPEEKPEPAETDDNTALPGQNKDQSSLSTCHLTLLKSRTPYCRDPVADMNVYGPTMVMIPPGNFTMGSNKEWPKHEVVIDYGFALSVHEITYGEFSRFCDTTRHSCPDQPWFGADYPVVNVSWDQARAYTRWLTEQTGKAYRLPSEAEWEYAARAGMTGIGSPTHRDAVFSNGKDWNGPLPKTDRSINRNRFQLYHTLGNVREWTADHWHSDYKGAPVNGRPWLDGESEYRVVRGGSYADSREAVRYSARLMLSADTADRYTGFRVVQEVDNS